MSAPSLKTITDAIVAAILPILKKGGKDAEDLAKQEAKEFADTLKKIVTAVQSGAMNQAQAEALLEAQKTVTEMTLETAIGLGKKIAQDTINAALGAVATIINAALPFALL